MTKNEGTNDRRFRVLLGLVMAALGFTVLDGGIGLAAIAVGLVAFVTGFIGWCPAYSVFGFSTCKTE